MASPGHGLVGRGLPTPPHHPCKGEGRTQLPQMRASGMRLKKKKRKRNKTKRRGGVTGMAGPKGQITPNEDLSSGEKRKRVSYR